MYSRVYIQGPHLLSAQPAGLVPIVSIVARPDAGVGFPQPADGTTLVMAAPSPLASGIDAPASAVPPEPPEPPEPPPLVVLPAVPLVAPVVSVVGEPPAPLPVVAAEVVVAELVPPDVAPVVVPAVVFEP